MLVGRRAGQVGQLLVRREEAVLDDRGRDDLEVGVACRTGRGTGRPRVARYSRGGVAVSPTTVAVRVQLGDDAPRGRGPTGRAGDDTRRGRASLGPRAASRSTIARPLAMEEAQDGGVIAAAGDEQPRRRRSCADPPCSRRAPSRGRSPQVVGRPVEDGDRLVGQHGDQRAASRHRRSRRQAEVRTRPIPRSHWACTAAFGPSTRVGRPKRRAISSPMAVLPLPGGIVR